MKKNTYIILGIICLMIIVGFFYIQNKDIKNISTSLKQNKIAEETKTEQGKNLFSTIDAKDFKKKIETGEYILVDIRTPDEYKNERIPGATLNLDYYAKDFKEQIDKLDKNKKYLYYCRSGHRSGLAKKYAEELNFKEVHELDGGINAWKASNYKTISDN